MNRINRLGAVMIGGLALAGCVSVQTQSVPKAAVAVPAASPSAPAPMIPAAPAPAPSEVRASPVASASGIQVPVPGGSDDLMVSVTSVTDMRNSQAAIRVPGCMLMLSFSGDAVADGTIERIHVTQAADDVGRDLLPGTESGNLTSNGMGLMRMGGMFTQVRLKNPYRRATEIKVLEGEVTIERPTEANGGVIRVSPLFDKPGQAISAPALQRLGIEVTYLTRDTYQAKADQMRAAMDSAAAPAEAQPGGVTAPVLSSRLLPRILTELPPWSDRNVGVLLVRDPGKSVRRLELDDADGNRVPSNTMNRIEYCLFYLQETPAPDDYLEITASAPGSGQTYPFRLEHIALP